jgi:hypothetical protein
LTDFNADFYEIAATVIPVFYLAHAVLRSITGGLLIWAKSRYVLALGICVCVCLPMVGEVAALAALYGRQATWEAVWTWISLVWAMSTFMAAAILALWRICREAQVSRAALGASDKPSDNGTR